MGRLFLVEFDDFDSGKFYVCRVCGTPFARNTDAFLYKKRPDEFFDEVIVISLLREISNVMDSDVVQKARNAPDQYDSPQSHCIACNKAVGFKFTDTDPQEPFICHGLLSSSVLFRMSGDAHDASFIPPDEWFDPPRPVGESM